MSELNPDDMNVIKSDDPTERMTRMVAAALDAFENHPEHRVSDLAIFCTNGGGRGGIVVHGYPEEGKGPMVLADLLEHARAVAEGEGIPLQVHTLGSDS